MIPQLVAGKRLNEIPGSVLRSNDIAWARLGFVAFCVDVNNGACWNYWIICRQLLGHLVVVEHVVGKSTMVLFLDGCCSSMSLWLSSGNGVDVNWSRWIHISCDDKPWKRKRELRLATATASWAFVMVERSLSSLRISSSNSWTDLSAMGFLLTFLTRPSSMTIRCWARIESWTSFWKPGAGSVRIIAEGPSRGINPTQSRIKPLLNSRWSSLSMIHASVNDVTDSRKTSMNCLSRLRTSPAKDNPMTGGGSEVRAGTDGNVYVG